LARWPRSRRDRIVTLTSDVGAAYAAQMKAALIAGGVPPGAIVDLTHDLPAHGIAEAAFLLREMARGFPSGSVHVVVVDPGVGGRRAPIVVVTRAGPLLVGPDNGVLSPLADELGVRSAVRIEPDRVRRTPRVGTTFDGRDLFAPAAARLFGGTPPATLGPPIRPKPYALPRAARTASGAQGCVLHVDRFGNLITNIPTSWVSPSCREIHLGVAVGSSRRVAWATSYESLGRGTLGALGSSFGLVELAVGEGRATDRLRARVGARVSLGWRDRPGRRGEKANSARPRKRA